MKRIAVNVRFLIKNKLEGIGVFTDEALKILTQKHKDVEFIFFFDRKYDKSFIYGNNVIPVVLSPPARHPFLWYYWFEISVTKALKKYKPDLFLSTDGYLSLRTKIPSFPVIHDLSFEHYPKDLNFFERKFYKKYMPKYAQKATKIITVSNFSKNDIAEKYNIDKNNISVVFNASRKNFVPLSREEKNKVKNELTGGAEYFLYLGALHQRKNITNLLKSYNLFRQQTSSNIKLVIIGRKAWGTQEMEDVYEEMYFKDDVIFTNWVEYQNLPKYVASAFALTYISYFEGFGIPIVEALSCQVPVIISQNTSLPEVAGDAAILVDPFNIENIADAMLLLVKNPHSYNKLKEKTIKQANKFNWERTADLLWKAIQ